MSGVSLQILKNLNLNKKVSSDQLIRLKEASVNIYSPNNNKFSTFKQYEKNEFISTLEKHQKKYYLIIQINNDKKLYEQIMKKGFKNKYDNIDKSSNLDIDYCFSPLNDLLFFNISLISNLTVYDFSKDLIQIYFYENGIYIINNSNCNYINEVFKEKFNFLEIDSIKFWDQLKNWNNEESKQHFINDINYSVILDKNIRKLRLEKENRSQTCKKFSYDQNILMKHNSVISSKGESKESNLYLIIDNSSEKDSIKKNIDQDDDYFKISYCSHRSLNDIKNHKGNLSGIETINNTYFSTDQLIYWLLIFSLDNLEEFSQSLDREADCLKGMYLELSEAERKDFFLRVHNTEVSMQLISQETTLKKQFLKSAKIQFQNYNELTNNFYFKTSFNFLIELMIAKVIQIEFFFQKLENKIKMIKENYTIIIEDNQEKETIKLNAIFKVLAIITAIYTPINLLSQTFQMNIQLPFQYGQDNIILNDSLYPFFGFVFFVIGLSAIQLFIFKRWNWY